MGKFIGYALLILLILFIVEWFQIFDIPYFEIPNYTAEKKGMIESTQKSLDQVK